MEIVCLLFFYYLFKQYQNYLYLNNILTEVIECPYNPHSIYPIVISFIKMVLFLITNALKVKHDY